MPSDHNANSDFEQQVAQARTIIQEITPEAARRLQQDGCLLVDVRDAAQRQLGMAAGARGITRAELPRCFTDEGVDCQQAVLTICAKGKQSLLAAAELHAAGFRNVRSVSGGLAAWQQAGLPVETPDSGLSAEQQERYARHLTLPEIGLEGQQKLLNSKILLVGAGGLGSPAALYLTAAGIGTLGIADDDRIERSNLQRQVLHSDAMCGEKKIESARQRLNGLNQDTHVVSFDQRLTAENASELIAGFDVVIDGSDNFATRYALNRACVAAGKPLVYAAVEAFQAQVAVFWPGYSAERDLPCYQCVFPQPGDGPSCVEAGILGVVPGVAGMLQATEALKLCLGIGQPLVDRLLRIDTLSMRFTESRIQRDPACPVCAGH